MKIEKFSGINNFESYAYFWDNVANPKAVVQIIHGMVEHINRYDFYAEFLNNNGFIVVGMDVRGHGKTAVEGLGLGVVTEGDSFADSVSDQILFSKYVKEKYNLPLFVMGLSFGSFLSQSYIERASDLVAGVIQCGSARQKGLEVTLGRVAAKMQCKIFGKDKPAKLITKLAFGGFDKQFAYDKIKNAWLCSNRDEVEKYNSDEMCGKVASLGFFRSLFCGVKDLYEECNLEDIRKDLNILLISGDKDPVGGNGKKVKKLYNAYCNAGVENVKMKLYSEKRHEILNEDIRDEVMFDTLKFYNSLLEKVEQ